MRECAGVRPAYVPVCPCLCVVWLDSLSSVGVTVKPCLAFVLVCERAALRLFRTYVGLLTVNFGVPRPTYLPTYPHAAASGRKTYLPTYLPTRSGGRKELPTYLPTYLTSTLCSCNCM